MLREENRKNRVMRKLCGPKTYKKKEELRRSHNEKCHDHTPGSVILKRIFQK